MAILRFFLFVFCCLIQSAFSMKSTELSVSRERQPLLADRQTGVAQRGK